MAKVRLLELRNTYKWGGGPDKTILLSAERHDHQRVEVTVAYVRDASDHEFRIAEKAKAKGLTFYEIEEHGKLDLRVVQVLADIVLRHDINLIHSHDYKSDLFAFLLRCKLRRRSLAVISTMHGWALSGVRGYIFWHLDLLLMRRFDHIIAVSHATKNEMVAAGEPANLISVIYNGIDAEAWSHCRRKPPIKDATGVDHAFPVIGYIGRISPEKDLETWLRACALVAKEFPVAKFVLVGEGRDETLLNQLKGLVAALGIADKVQFLGYRDDLQCVYAAFDVFFLSSRREGICNSLLEAMAMEIPLVTTGAGGTYELVTHRENGYIVPEGNPEAMARAIVTIVQDDHLRDRLVRNGRKRVEDEFSFDVRLKRIEALYETIVERRADSSAHSRIPVYPTS